MNARRRGRIPVRCSIEPSRSRPRPRPAGPGSRSRRLGGALAVPAVMPWRASSISVCAFTTAAALLLLTFPAHGDPGPESISPETIAKAHAEASGRVVGVRFVMKQVEVEPGVEGPRMEGDLCGVVVAPGIVMVPGDVFPEPGGDPRTTLVPSEFEIRTGADESVGAEAIGLDRKLNLAYLRFDPAEAPGLRPVDFRPDPPLEVGDPVILVGLLSERYDFAPALYRGTLNSSVTSPVPLMGVDALVQDLTVGGLVLRGDGSAAGVVVKDLLPEEIDMARTPGNFISIVANTGQFPLRRPGYAMVLPHAGFAESMASPPPVDLDTEMKRAWLGIVMQALDEDLRDYWKLPVPGGIIIGSVVDGSPSHAAGLRQGDILTRIEGEEIRITENAQLGDFRRKIERMAAGEEIEFEVYRNRAPMSITIRLGDAPRTAALAEDYEDKDFGLRVREMTIDVQQAMNLGPDVEGVFIESTESSGWVDVAGIVPQDIILAINGVRVRSVGDVRDALSDIKHRQDPEAIFFIMRPPDTLFLRVRTEFRGSRASTNTP